MLLFCFFVVQEGKWEVVKMFTCIACTKQAAKEKEEEGESGTPSTNKEAVKSLSAQVLTLHTLGLQTFSLGENKQHQLPTPFQSFTST